MHLTARNFSMKRRTVAVPLHVIADNQGNLAIRAWYGRFSRLTFQQRAAELLPSNSGPAAEDKVRS